VARLLSLRGVPPFLGRDRVAPPPEKIPIYTYLLNKILLASLQTGLPSSKLTKKLLSKISNSINKLSVLRGRHKGNPFTALLCR